MSAITLQDSDRQAGISVLLPVHFYLTHLPCKCIQLGILGAGKGSEFAQ